MTNTPKNVVAWLVGSKNSEIIQDSTTLYRNSVRHDDDDYQQQQQQQQPLDHPTVDSASRQRTIQRYVEQLLRRLRYTKKAMLSAWITDVCDRDTTHTIYCRLGFYRLRELGLSILHRSHHIFYVGTLWHIMGYGRYKTPLAETTKKVLLNSPFKRASTSFDDNSYHGDAPETPPNNDASCGTEGDGASNPLDDNDLAPPETPDEGKDTRSCCKKMCFDYRVTPRTRKEQCMY
jgi:hypothetical protein